MHARTSTIRHPDASGFSAGPTDAKTAIIAVHGFGGTPYDFRSWADVLAGRGLRVICPLLPGHGGLPAGLFGVSTEVWMRDLVAAVTNCRKYHQQVLLLGASFGGALAVATAAQVSVDGVVLVNPAFRYRKLNPITRTYLRLRAIVNPMLPKLGYTDQDRQRAAISGSLVAWPITTLLSTDQFLREKIPGYLKRISTPVALLLSTHDAYVDGAYARHVTRDLPNRTVIDLPHDNHRPFHDPAAVTIIAEATMRMICGSGENVVT